MAELTVVEQSIALSQPGKLNTDDGSVDCEVLSLSRKGAQVRLDGALDGDGELYLAIRDFGLLSCRIMDRDGDYADLRFQGDPETLEAVFQEILGRLGDDEGQRRYLRRSVLWPGSLQTRQGALDCTILNMSLGGAKVALSEARECSGNVTLLGDRFEGLSAFVMWQRGRLIGLQFKDAPADVARVLGDLLPAIRASA